MIPRTRVNYDSAAIARALRAPADCRERLRQRLVEYTGKHNVLLAPSGRGALYFLLRALPQATVVIPAYTCTAVTQAAKLAGKKLIYVAIERDGFNLDPDALSELPLSDCAVIATHQFGIPCDIERICAIVRAAGGVVIEDAAAALGSRVDGRLVGSFGDMAFYSFDSTKLINVPLKAGFATVNDAATFDRVSRIYRDEIETMPRAHQLGLLCQVGALLGIQHPWAYRLFHLGMFELRGRTTAESPNLDLSRGPYFRYDVTQWQASLALEQLAVIDDLIARRQLLYAHYRAQLADCRSFELPPVDAQRQWACIRFPILVRGDKYEFYREAARQGVDFAFSFSTTVCPPHFTRATQLAGSVLDLPYYDRLTTSEQDRVVRVLRRVDRQHAPVREP